MSASAFFKSQNRAALALHEDYLRYVELDGDLSGLKMRRKIQTATGGTAIRKDSLSDVGALLPAFENLGGSLGGGFKAPVTIGVPSRDILIRVIELPEMEMEDAKEALKWDFEKFFPYAYTDAAVDIARVDNPVNLDPGKMSVLVAACRLRTVESLMRVASSAGMDLAGIEPLNVAMFRPAWGRVGLRRRVPFHLRREGSDPARLGYKDNGICTGRPSSTFPLLVRVSGITPSRPGIGNTLTFVKNQYRELVVDLLMLGGGYGKDSRLQEALEAATGLKTLKMNVWETWGIAKPDDGNSGWEAAIGLAVRDLL